MKRFFVMSILTTLLSFFGCEAQNKKYSSVNPVEFEKVITDSLVVRLDVRTSGEYAEGHIEGALNMDVQNETFELKAKQLPLNHTIAVYCRSGRRSKRAADILVKLGYNVIELDNGYLGWVESGRSVVK